MNDVVVTRDAAYFSDSFRPVFYRVPLDANGVPGDASQEIALTGDFVQVPGPFVFNSNGIDATPDGSSLILANSAREELYLVDPGTGYATVIDLGGDSVPAGDGILLDGKTLYAVQNTLNQIAVVELDPGFTSGKVVGFLSSAFFRAPTTVAELGPHSAVPVLAHSLRHRVTLHVATPTIIRHVAIPKVAEPNGRVYGCCIIH